MKAVIIGGGIIGLSSALYLSQSGWEVTVLDKGDFSDNCSYGNAGYVCPSHFVPLATPGIIQQGLKWMWNSRSPFYVEPRLSASLVNWGLKFMQSATPEKVRSAAVPLRDIALLSQQAYVNWQQIAGLEMAYEHKGLLEYFQTPEKEAYAHHFCEDAHALRLAARILTAAEVQAMEPSTRLNIKGALLFECDAHLYPNKIMRSLLRYLTAAGVNFRKNEQVTGFEKQGQRIRSVKTSTNAYEADAVLLTAGAWSGELAAKLNIGLPLVGGRGYSVTLEDSPNILNHPAVLMEGRVALTPMDGNKLRMGGTMEITSLNKPPRLKRVEGILAAVKQYFPDFILPKAEDAPVWYGYRPCSADGLPYIGRSNKWQNLLIGTGHAMIGMSLGAGTGLLLSELANETQPSIDLTPFAPERFS